MKETKEPIKIKLTVAVLLFIIVLLVIGMVGMFVYYNSNSKVNEEQQENIQKQGVIEKREVNTNELETNATKINEEEALEEKQLDLTSNLVQQLYKYILKYSDYSETLVYQSKKVTEETMENQLKLMTVFENLSEEDADDVDVKSESGMEIMHTFYNKETVEKKAQEIFGKDVTITHESCPIIYANAIDYQNGVYERYDYQGGGGTPWSSSMSQIERAEQKGDEIYIYDKYIHIYYGYEENNPEEGIYTASDRKTKISDLLDISIDYGPDEEQNKNELFNKYNESLGNKIKTFKHTFKKNSDGTYYWYSTEPM